MNRAVVTDFESPECDGANHHTRYGVVLCGVAVAGFTQMAQRTRRDRRGDFETQLWRWAGMGSGVGGFCHRFRGRF